MIALYKFRFYELDQPIGVGDDQEFSFFVDPHFSAAPESPLCDGMILVFANTTGTAAIIRRRCRIRSITHPALGAVKAIATDGFDYRITLESGRVLTVDAEERAGILADTDIAVTDWAFIVDVDIGRAEQVVPPNGPSATPSHSILNPVAPVGGL